MARLTYPIVLAEIFQNALPLVDIAFVGQLGKDELAAAALATVWFNLWNSAMVGFMTAIDTVLSSTHGAGQREDFAVWTGNSLVVVFVATIIVSVLMALCGPAMKLFGQDPELSDAAGEFSFRLIPGLLPYYLFKVLTKYLQTQNRLAPSVWIGVLANGMNALFNWGLISVADWGIAGAPWATTLTRLMEFLLILVYMFFQRNVLKDTLPIFSRENLRWSFLKPVLKLAVSGALSVIADAWSFNITPILAGLFGTVALDAHIITMTISDFIYLSFPMALGIAASIQVGHLVGDRKSNDAKRSSHVSYFLGIAMQIIVLGILFLCKDILGNVFSSNEDIARLVSQLIPIMSGFLLGDAVQAVTCGVLRGLGRQKIVLWLNVIGFWCFVLPIGAVLSFPVGMGVFGLWWGFVIGVNLAAMLGVWYLHRVDWGHEVDKTVKRLSKIASTRNIMELVSSPSGENLDDNGETGI